MQAVVEQLEATRLFGGRVHPVAKLAQLLERGGLAQVCPAAFVLPLGLRGGRADAATGLFRQDITRYVGVVLAARHAGDATGAKADELLQPMIDGAIGALAGWSPDGEEGFGVMTLAKGELVSLSVGTLTYQLDFNLDDQLRIAR